MIQAREHNEKRDALSYPPIPEHEGIEFWDDARQSLGAGFMGDPARRVCGWVKPYRVHGWEWSVDFGCWKALVEFREGSEPIWCAPYWKDSMLFEITYGDTEIASYRELERTDADPRVDPIFSASAADGRGIMPLSMLLTMDVGQYAEFDIGDNLGAIGNVRRMA